MKKVLAILILMIISSSLFAQNFEVIKELPFGNPIEYYEKWDKIEGGRPGIQQLFSWKNNMFVFDKDKKTFFDINNLNQKIKFDSFLNILSFNQKNDLLVLGDLSNKYNIYTKSGNITNPDFTVDVNSPDYDFVFYYTEEKLFSITYEQEFVYWELLSDGKTKFHNVEQKKKEMEEELEDHLGIHNIGSQIYFGETSILQAKAPNFSKYWKEIEINNDKYKWLEPHFSTAFSYEGTDKKGLSYYTTLGNGFDNSIFDDPNLALIYVVAVLDPWTHKVNLVELPAGDWNPPRNEDGFISVNSSCIDYDGNLYLTDCNKAKGCYEIKKLSNDWVKKYDFYEREIGRMNANHIPLQMEANATAENNGFNFEYEYLWILDHGTVWSKVRKVDGREGWVMNRYIDFN